jgi:hemolysin activation/secretion protein
MMLALVRIQDGRAADTNPPAVIENLFAAPLASSTPAKLLPTLDVRTYQIEGNTALLPEEFGMLSNYTGKVDSPRVREGLDKLQGRYGELGFSNVKVTLPEQKFTNGLVRIQIINGDTGTNTEAALAAAITNLFTVPEKKQMFEVLGYLIEGNENVLPPEKFGVLSNYTGNVDFARVRDGLGVLQLLYRDLGFATVSVRLPQQKLTNGIVHVKVVEGKLASIKVTGNFHFSTGNVLRALPSLGTNILLNTKWFQPELDRANQNQDRQIYPVIGPGLEPGTSDLTLQVKDQLPLHGHMEVNDKSTPGTPLLRLDTAVQYNNLWQREHQIGFDYNFSPQEMKSDNNISQFYNQPMVSSYSGFYRLPLGYDHGLREDTDNLPVDFGYDEVTHKFNLPPATGNPDFIFYASGSTSDTPVTKGPLTSIFSNTLAEITSQSQQVNPTYNYNLGTKLTVPLPEFLGVQSSLLFGFDYKYYQSKTYSTNVTFFNLYSLDSFGNRVLVTNETIRLPANSGQLVYYLPLSLGWAASRPDALGAFSFNYNQSFFFAPLANAQTNFQNVAESSKAGGNYTTINAGLIRLQNLPGSWSAIFNANGQWASEPLISNEQFALGGTSGVRGYQEGEAYGDTGWRTQFDLRAPPVNVGCFPTAKGDVPASLRVSWFMDYGQVYSLNRSQNNHLDEWGTGIGFYLTAGEHFDARLTLGWALEEASSSSNPTQTSVTTTVGECEAYFSVGCQF